MSLSISCCTYCFHKLFKSLLANYNQKYDVRISILTPGKKGESFVEMGSVAKGLIFGFTAVT
jgi:hypothetical protein